MRTYLPRLLAPYLAVLVFWCWLHNAWACILVYHAQILVWSRWDLPRVAVGWRPRRLLLAGMAFLGTGPLAYALLPLMAEVPVDAWLSAHGLSGVARWLMVPYFGVVHPLLEQAHWSSLRTHPRLGALAHVGFAGYHVLVLSSLISAPWVAASFGILLLASETWRRMEVASRGGLSLPALAHVLADSGLVVAAILRAR